MKKIMHCSLALILLSLTLMILSAQPVLAQSDFGRGVAHTYQIDEEVSAGDILVGNDNQYLKSTKAYSPGVVGIVVDQPAVVFTQSEDTGVAILKVGDADVRVSTVNGDIQAGDYLTTSDIPGVAMKAITSGFVIGLAKADLATSDSEAITLLPVDLQITFVELGEMNAGTTNTVGRSLWDIFNLNRLAVTESPAQVFKYTIAAILLIASFGFGFYIFGRTANKGIDAMGRNPLAGKAISFSILLNVLLTIVIIAAGVGLSYVILVL